MTGSDFLVVKEKNVFERLERKVKTVRILNVETNEKVSLREGAGSEDDFTEDEGGFFHDPVQTGYKTYGKGEQEQYAKIRHPFFYSQTFHTRTFNTF